MEAILDTKLPSGWKWVKLKDVCIINPRRVPNLNIYDEQDVTFIPMPAVDAVSGTITHPEIKKYREVRKGYTYFEENDVLFAKITPCMQNGKHVIARNLLNQFGFGTTEFHVIRPKHNIVSEWIHFYLRRPEIIYEATQHFTGAVGQQRVPADFLKELNIPLPPLDVQKLITKILNQRLEAVETARRTAEEQLKTAQVLPAAYLREVFESEEAKEWPKRELLELCQGTGQYGTSKKSNVDNVGVPILGMYHIHEGRIRWENISHIALNKDECRKYLLKRGDLLFNRTNSAELVGKTAVFDIDRAAVFASYLIRFCLNPILAEPYFISAYINSHCGRRFIEKNMARAIGQVNISASVMHRMPIPSPSIKQQQEIAKKLKQQTEQSRILEEQLENQMNEINAIPSSLLRKAFQGGL